MRFPPKKDKGGSKEQPGIFAGSNRERRNLRRKPENVNQKVTIHELLYAVRVISEGRLATETHEGLQEALAVLLREREQRRRNPQLSEARAGELEKLRNHASARIQPIEEELSRLGE